MSGIEWTDRSDWNPIRGCSRESEGCRNCYAEAIAARFSSRPGEPFYEFAEKTTKGPRWTGKVEIIPSRIALPLTWRKPSKVFVNSASDIFHPAVKDEWIDDIFAVMALCPQHIFQVLTKRPERMEAYFNGPYPTGDGVMARIADATFKFCPQGKLPGGFFGAERAIGPNGQPEFGWRRFFNLGPIPNIWLGTSIESDDFVGRAAHLLRTHAAVRFVSCEPLLSKINLCSIPTACLASSVSCCGGSSRLDALRGVQWCERAGAYPWPEKSAPPTSLSWVIVGGENGPRSMDLDWARSLIAQCREASVPCFMKQLGCGHGTKDRKGGDPDEWPEDLRVRQFPEARA